MYFNEGGRTAHKALWGAVWRNSSWHVLLPKSSLECQLQSLANNRTVQRCMKREAKNRLGPALKAWRAMCTVEDKTGIPLPGCAIGSQGARWA